MSDPIFKINVAEWVASAKADPVAYQQRQTVEITLNAIAMTAPLNTKDVLEGRHPHGTRLWQSKANNRH